MDEENINGTSEKFGKVIDALHNKSKLPSLRTYQGDMAEFIKEKNESVISIAVKEKEKIEEEEKNSPTPKVEKKSFQMNFTIIAVSLLLILGGAGGLYYIFEVLKREPTREVLSVEKIIPYNNLVTLADLTNGNLASELAKLPPANGVSILKLSNSAGLSLEKAQDFFAFLQITLPATLDRTLKDEYAVGMISQNNQTSNFLIITASDFGRAFSGMLDWEKSIAEDLSFLNSVTENWTASTTVPASLDSFSWKDIIVKNKDTRALINSRNQTKIAYTFLDRNTILITKNSATIGDLYSIYASRSVVR